MAMITWADPSPLWETLPLSPTTHFSNEYRLYHGRVIQYP